MKVQDVPVTRPETRLPQSRAGGQGPHLRSLEHLDRRSDAKDRKNKTKHATPVLTKPPIPIWSGRSVLILLMFAFFEIFLAIEGKLPRDSGATNTSLEERTPKLVDLETVNKNVENGECSWLPHET